MAQQPSILKDLILFTKLRLASLVVVSAYLSYMLASDKYDWQVVYLLIAGGFLVTSSSNGINQILERNLDKLMDRTKDRPLAAERMSLSTAILVSVVTGVSGLFLLYQINFLSFLLGAFALLSYAFAYTPLKQKSPFAVFVGAFPGAIPAMLGWVAHTNSIDVGAIIVFAVQFIWQFPHFWAIAWVLDDDYKKAGFKMLPSAQGRDKVSAFQTLVYSLSLVPICITPYIFNISGLLSAIICVVLSLAFSYQAFKLLKSCQIADARKLMLASFVYLPLVQFILFIDKI
jgi:heme o synthase